MQITQKKYPSVILGYNDTLHSLCRDLNLDESDIMNINDKQEFAFGDVILLCKPHIKNYVVKPLDTKEHIAKALNISIEELEKITNNKKLFIGQKIIV